MSSLEVILLALIQGVTEFFPVSSSAHLILGRWLLGWQDPGLFMDVAVHVGTLGAVLVYFSRDVGRLLRGGVSLVRGRITGDTHFFLTLALATVPLVAIGFMVDRWGGDRLRTMEVLGWSTLFFGCLMYGADRWGRQDKKLQDPHEGEAFWGWGMAQVLALIHGASRSGVCMTFGRLRGYARVDVARFAFLMSIPAVGAAGTLKTIQFCCLGDWTLLGPACLGMVVSFLTGIVALGVFMWWVRHFSLTAFALYRILLGCVLLWGVYG